MCSSFAENPQGAALALAAEWLREPRARWAVGVIGAIAEFEHGPGEAVATRGLTATGPFGALRISDRPQARALAYELPSADPRAWLHGVVFCLPEADARGAGRTTITELGPDEDAVRPEDRSALLFDLGIGSPWCDVCVRTADAPLIALLRAHAGRDILDPAHSLLERIPSASPARVFSSRLARIEVWQRIPRHGEPSPEGSHTHFLPRMLRPMRTVQATVPVPDGWATCLSLFPPNPQRDTLGRSKPFDRAEHDAFQALLARFGEPAFVAAKLRCMHAAPRNVGPVTGNAVTRAPARQGISGRTALSRSERLARMLAGRQRDALGSAAEDQRASPNLARIAPRIPLGM